MLLLLLMLAAIFVTPALQTHNRLDAEAIYFVPGDPPLTALTFESLWSSRDLDAILAVLDEKNVRSTFFISGNWLKQNQAAAKQILEAGHEIGNHTVSQGNLLHAHRKELSGEIAGFNELARDLLEYTPELFRPPLGIYNGAVLQEARLNRCRTIIWSVESYDTISDSGDEILNRVLGRARGGSIIVFRVGAVHLPQALPAIIDGLRARGYEPVAVSDLIEYTAQQ